MDRLFSPWRLEYITGEKRPAADCIFCLSGVAGDDAHPPDPLVVFRGTTCYVVLNKYPYNNGHLLIVPYRHTPSLVTLTPEELQEMAVLTQRSEIVLREAYSPEGINVGINLGKPAGAGIVEHVHIHAVPRWNGDTNFMTVFGDTRVLPENLSDSAARLTPIFDRLSKTGA
jgi:ATP adenylyltransferase